MTNRVSPIIFNSIKTISLIQLKPFDTATEEGRSRERHRRIILTSAASVSAKAITVISTLILVPVALNYLGTEMFGVWMTISSFTALMAFADLGLGNGLINAISVSHGKGDANAVREYVSSSFFILTGVSILLLAVFLIIQPQIDWGKVFNLSNDAQISEAGAAMMVFVVSFVLNIPLGIAQRVEWGYQQGYSNNIWSATGSILGVAFVIAATRLDASLPWMVAAFVGAPLLALISQNVLLFVKTKPRLRPRVSYIKSSAVRVVLRLGLLFFVLQIAVSLAYASDNLVAVQTVGPEGVAEYSVAMRLFSIPTILLGLLFMPLWPAYGEAIGRGDIGWVKRTFTRSIAITIGITVIPSLIFVLFGSRIITMWAGEAVKPSSLLLLGLGLWTVIGGAGNTVAMFLNGANIVKFQVICAGIMSVTALILKIGLSNYIGTPGIIWGTLIAYFLFMVIPITIYLPRVFNKIHKQH